jgi:diguanylate cyclase (GGDEF)-like protein
MSIEAAGQPQRRRLLAQRLICVMAVLVAAAALACGVAGYALVRQADEAHAIEHRAGLLHAIDDIRASGEPLRFDAALLGRLERITGAGDLKFEAEPAGRGRELQSVLDGQGRIVGWLSWEPQRAVARTMLELSPLMTLTGLLVFGFSGLALWHVRRTMRELALSEHRAWALANQDIVTGLPNQRKLGEGIDERLSRRTPGEIVGLALVDIDGLNEVNEVYGHQAGDAFVAAWSQRLAESAGEADCGRFDGDQFGIVLTGPDAGTMEADLRAVTAALARPFWIADRAVQLGCTAGLAFAPTDADKREDLIRRAELALRAAKRSDRGGIVRFKPEMDIEVAERRFIERELKRAIAADSLAVHYQPIVTSDGSRIVGAEALLRWTHRERGAIPPAIFVAVAEQAGMMGQLGAFVLRRALTDAMRWPDIDIAVNLSPVQVRDPALVDMVREVLRETGLPASRLILEVTEGVLIDNPDEAKARLDALRELGLRLALDDFGTGYSSLTYLQRFRFDKLKIDRGFVAPLGRSGDSHAIVQGIVGLGRALGLSILAEGVETEEQRVLLRLAGCEEMQGFLFARPAPREALDRLLSAAQPANAALRNAG